MNSNVLLAGVLAIIVIAVAVIGGRPRAQDHHPLHDIYKNWSPPLNPGTSCCNNNDCRPTKAYMGDDGLWRAWSGQRWLTVPKDRVLPPDYARDGRSHICEQHEFIHCFTPGEPKI